MCPHFVTSMSDGELTMCAGAAIIIKGQYYAPGQTIPPDDTKLYLLIEGPTHHVVKHAKTLIKQMIEEKTEKSMRREAGATRRFNIA
jgi:ATP-dependent RNA helicase DDX46/PRP5